MRCRAVTWGLCRFMCGVGLHIGVIEGPRV